MMSQWNTFTKWWRSRGITTKFSLAFGMQFFLLFLIAAVSIGALMVARYEIEQSIFISTHIQHLILEMDRHLEKSRRLERDFFLRYPTLGFSAAYEQYALPAEEHVRQVHALNEELHNFLKGSEMTEVWRLHESDLAFYSATVVRHATGTQEATALVSRLANETNGLYDQLSHHASHISDLAELEKYPALHQLFHTMQDFEREYFLSGQRPLMQSAFNVGFELRQAFEQSPGLETTHKEQALRALEAYQAVAEEILDLNVTLRSLFNEFDLQANAIDPVAEGLISVAHQEIERIRAYVRQMSSFVTLLLLFTTFLGLGVAGVTAVVFNSSVTRNIIKLTRSAKKFKAGRLHERARIESADELGQLADSFNTMAIRLEELIWNLEENVVDRTKALSTANRQLEKEIAVRQKAEEELKGYSERLELMVDERTQELQEAQDALIRREKLATLGQLAGGVAHELRHPLGVLSNAVYFLEITLSTADARTREYLGIMNAEVRKSQNIISTLLNFAGSKPVTPEKTDVPTLITQSLKEQPAPESVWVSTEFAPQLPPAFVDPVQIGLVMGNLVKNAYQAMPEGGALHIRAATEQHRVRLSFSDTGRGISEEHLEKLFEPLFTTKMRGIGLGLAISKNLIESNGGNIEVESEEGKGSTFTLSLPCRECS